MNGRSIQDIVPPARSKPIRPSVHQNPPPTPPPYETHQEPMNDEPRSSLPFLWIAAGAVAIAVVVVGLMSTVFHTAHVNVTLMEWKSDVSGSYMAGGDSMLTYTPVKVTSQATRTVPATGSVDASDRASGTIVVSNSYSAKPQRLITNTRFESSDGKVYRIHAPVTVPGYTTRNSQKIAGTAEAVVFADQPGDTYNLDTATFKLPGLKGTNQYDVITAVSKGPIAGGFIGKRATVEKSVRDQAIADMKAELDRTLREKIIGAAPPASIVLGDSINIRYVEHADAADGNNATLAIDGTASAPGFPGDAFARELGSRATVAQEIPVALVNQTELQFALISGADVESGGPISFTLSGMAHLRAVFNERAFAEDLAGKTKAEANQIQGTYKGISSTATISVRPFWLSSLPKNPERITVAVKGALDQ
jgi:hypothetical protein